MHGGSAGNNYLFAGDGLATLFGGGNGDQLFAYGDMQQMLVGSAGTATLSGAFSSGDNVFISGTGNESIVGGTGKDLFIGGCGSDTVFATDGGRDTFQFIRGMAGGQELVQNVYDSNSVKIMLTNYCGNEKQSALNSQTTDGSSVSFTLSDGTRVTFENITHLSAKNFI